MPAVHSRPLIENDGNNVALRRTLRLVKKLILQGRDLIIEGGLITEEFLDTLGLAIVKLTGLLGYPLYHWTPKPDIFEMFSSKSLPQALPLVFVFHIILLIYSTYVLCYLPAVGLGFDSWESITFHIITALAIVSYYRGVTTDPGGIPPGPEWEKDRPGAKQEGLRFCSREKKYKPERTHYCSAIGRNVLKMDHYCPWLGNCVGFFNYKFFLLFLTYATVACGWTTISSARLLAASSGGFLGKLGTLSAGQVFFLTEGLCISSLISLILTPFTGFHYFLLGQNKTTLEYCEKTHSEVSYDKGVFGNFFSVFGYNPLLWLVPIQSTPGNGLAFERVALAPTTGDNLPSSSSDDDIEEKKVREKLSLINGQSSARPGGSCCFRNWDSGDSPLMSTSFSSSGGFSDFVYSKCVELNSFRDRLVRGFSNIMNKEEVVVDDAPNRATDIQTNTATIV